MGCLRGRGREAGYSESCDGVAESVVQLAVQRGEDGGVPVQHGLYGVGLPETLGAAGDEGHEGGVALECVADIAGVADACVHGGAVDEERHIEEQEHEVREGWVGVLYVLFLGFGQCKSEGKDLAVSHETRE